ncbi:chorismate-binding protein [Nakamurella leprariae]|uniref:Anthranilate synthase component I family protein n=1 Tax=Nakamurella leprariae TaxID=2803911 RepID=A0A938YFZ4_9ACTN|nr:anthranilate synthase component I family protein [Nakamurella leprariae]MBM9469189.1 anthranilate synthase component I family protein [Nakamurella leprariae]
MPPAVPPAQPAPGDGDLAWFGGTLATGLLESVDLTADASPLDGGGWWAVVAEFGGRVVGHRFATVRPAPLPAPVRAWAPPTGWVSSLDRAAYVAGVRRIQQDIRAGRVYQVNLCRMLHAAIPDDADPLALAARLAAGNPAPFQGVVRAGTDWVVTASPELFLARDGEVVSSAPIKGTTGPRMPFAAKDLPENIMITDLVRNDLGRVARPGTVQVTGLAVREEHPGLAHLVSTVQARLRPGVGWTDLLAATLPPGSVSGAPKHTALQVISELEPERRGVYCGAVGWVDADRGSARLAVGIRTFASAGPHPDDPAGRRLTFGTGAGITIASDPDDEWAETELKAARLLSLAGGRAG